MLGEFDLDSDPVGDPAPDIPTVETFETSEASETGSPEEVFEREPVSEIEIKTIELHVTEKNLKGWPQSWWLDERPRLISVGWSVSVKKNTTSDEGKEPYFKVQRGKNTTTFVGRHTAEQIILGS
jgi:hypothetical protein